MHILRTALLKFRYLCCSNSWPICLSHEKSDPKVRIVSVQRHNSDLNSVLTVEATSSNFQYGSYFGVPSDPSFWCRCSFIFWQRRHDKPIISVNYENSSVSSVMKYCPISTKFKNPASIRNVLYLNCWENLSIRSPSLSANRRSVWARSSQSNGTSVLITLGTNEELDRPMTTGCPFSSFKKKVSYSYSHFWGCSVKTEKIYRKSIMLRSLNRLLVGCIVCRQISISFAFEPTSGQWNCCTENWTSNLNEFQQHLFRQFVPDSLWGLLS